MTFRPDSGADDPAVTFAGGGRTSPATIPAGSTNNVNAGSVQIGTVAGTITITTQLLAGNHDGTPSPAPVQTIRVAPGAPVISSITVVRNSSGFTVTIVGFSTPRQLTQAAFTFTAAAGANLQTGNVTVPVDSAFAQWFGSSAAGAFGSQFTFTQPFPVSGNLSAITSVSVTLVNGVGTSNAMTANLQ